jgi:hypothetical protein
MMHRRSLLGLIGLGTAAALVPAAPAIAQPAPTPAIAQPDDAVKRTLYRAMTADVELTGGLRYRAPVELKYVESGELVMWFRGVHTGTIRHITFLRGKTELLTVSGADMDSPHTVAGTMVRVTVGPLAS